MYSRLMNKGGIFVGLTANIITVYVIMFALLALVSEIKIDDPCSALKQTWLIFLYAGALVGVTIWMMPAVKVSENKNDQDQLSSGWLPIVITIVCWVVAIASIPLTRPYVLDSIAKCS